ncbi:MAG: hypothetical protein P8J27_02685 [Mariniblastus sp.]|nr:hypothetical protein [Mariniblastus sp.]
MITKPQHVTKERSNLFRALGPSNPPDQIEINSRSYALTKIVKHDSWAATSFYQSADSGPKHTVVCKLNRIQPIGLIPMAWLGRRLAQRESRMYQELSDLPNIAEGYNEVLFQGKVLPNACAHDFLDGHPLRWHDNVDDLFFDGLDNTLTAMHQRNIAYVDMNKSENVIVNQQGEPCLIDFQISVRWHNRLMSGLLSMLQKSDLYHSFKLRRRFRPDQVETDDAKNRVPWWIRGHRMIANPFRATRRRLLVALGIRSGNGKPQSEAFIEEALQSSGDKIIGNDLEKPILRLYQLLRSPLYVERFGSSHDYVAQMAADLIGENSAQLPDQDLLQKIIRTNDHDKVVELLRSKIFFVLSDCWDSNALEAIITRIEMSLSPQSSAITPLSSPIMAA